MHSKSQSVARELNGGDTLLSDYNTKNDIEPANSRTHSTGEHSSKENLRRCSLTSEQIDKLEELAR